MKAPSHNKQEPQGIGQIIESIPQNATPQQLQGLNAIVQVRSVGADPGEWMIAIKDGACTVTKEAAPSPDLTLEGKSDVWLSVVNGKVDPAWAFISGQLR